MGRISSTSPLCHSCYCIIAAGADQAYLTMSEAGVGLAEHVRQRIMPAATKPKKLRS